MSDAISAEQTAQSTPAAGLARCEVTRNDLLSDVDSAVYRMMLAFIQAGGLAKQDISALVEQATADFEEQRARIRDGLRRARAELEAVALTTAPSMDTGEIAEARANAEREAAAILEDARQRGRDAADRLEETRRELAEIETEAQRQLDAVVAQSREHVQIVITGVQSYPSAARLVLALQQDPLTTVVEPTHFEPGQVSLHLETVPRGLNERILSRLQGAVELVSDGHHSAVFRLLSSP